jgi:transcription-repair coupling factor (superfamily II helicase)
MQDDPNASVLFANASHTSNSKNWCNDSQLDSDLSLCFPVTYIENISERIALYRELDNLSNEETLLEYQKRLIDRFGALPEEAEQLLNVVRLRWLCCQIGIEKVLLKKENLTLYFTQSHKQYWQSDIFGRVGEFIYSRPQRCKLVEEKDRQGKKTGRIYATIQQVKTITGAIHLLNKIQNPTQL